MTRVGTLVDLFAPGATAAGRPGVSLHGGHRITVIGSDRAIQYDWVSEVHEDYVVVVRAAHSEGDDWGDWPVSEHETPVVLANVVTVHPMLVTDWDPYERSSAAEQRRLAKWRAEIDVRVRASDEATKAIEGGRATLEQIRRGSFYPSRDLYPNVYLWSGGKPFHNEFRLRDKKREPWETPRKGLLDHVFGADRDRRR